MLELNEVKEKMYELGDRVGIDRNSSLYPMFSSTSIVFGDGSSIYTYNSKYHYVIMERGNEIEHHVSKSLDDILYLVFSNITFTLATNYEVKHRKDNQDFRRLLWAKQLELLKNISINYYEIEKKEVDRILKISPYRDQELS